VRYLICDGQFWFMGRIAATWALLGK